MDAYHSEGERLQLGEIIKNKNKKSSLSQGGYKERGSNDRSCAESSRRLTCRSRLEPAGEFQSAWMPDGSPAVLFFLNLYFLLLTSLESFRIEWAKGKERRFN